jgi:renalase
MTKIAIIGAGISGLNLAKNFATKNNSINNNLNNSQQNIEYTVFEKARGVGGRMATRRADDFAFDHGAQCFTARTKEFQNFIEPFQEQKIIEQWQGKVISIEEGKKFEKRIWFEPHLTASPAMNSLCKELAKDLNIKLETEVAKITSQNKMAQNNKWLLTSKTDEVLGEFDWVISTAPPAQTYNLMPDVFEHKNEISNIQMHVNFSVMVGFKTPLNLPWIAAKTRRSIIKWISINSSKPSRNPENTCIIIHSKDSWADKNKDMPVADVQNLMLEEFSKLTGIDTKNADFITTHRWLYSIVATTTKAKTYTDAKNKLAACSDWCLSSRIEEAWISSEFTYKKILENL